MPHLQVLTGTARVLATSRRLIVPAMISGLHMPVIKLGLVNFDVRNVRRGGMGRLFTCNIMLRIVQDE